MLNLDADRPSVDEALKLAFGADEPATPETPEVAAEPVAALAPDTAPEAVTETPATPEAPAAAPTPAAQPAAPDNRVAALMRQEADLLAQRQAFEAEKASIKQAALEEAKQAAIAEARRDLALRPLEYLRKLDPNLDPRGFVEDVWYDANPDSAPVEWKAKKAQRTAAVYQTEHERTKADLDAVTKRQSELQAQQEAEASERAYVATLQSYVSAVPDSLPRARHLASQKPDRAAALMHDAARMIAQRENRVPTPEEAAKAVDEYLDGIGYAAAPAPAPAPPPVSAPVTPPVSLRNNASAVQPGREMPDEMDERVLRRRALEAAGLDPNLFG